MSELTREQVNELIWEICNNDALTYRQKAEPHTCIAQYIDYLSNNANFKAFKLECEEKTKALDQVDALLAQLQARDATIAKYQARLEIDHCFDIDMKQKDIALEDRDKFPDGITCRDATIQLQDEDIKKLRDRRARLEGALKALLNACNALVQSNDIALIVTESTIDAETMEEQPTRVTQDFVNELWNQFVDATEQARHALGEGEAEQGGI